MPLPAGAMAESSDIETRLLHAISESSGAVESDALAQSLGVEHSAVVGCVKSLLTCDMITAEVQGLARFTMLLCCTNAPRRVAESYFWLSDG